MSQQPDNTQTAAIADILTDSVLADLMYCSFDESYLQPLNCDATPAATNSVDDILEQAIVSANIFNVEASVEGRSLANAVEKQKKTDNPQKATKVWKFTKPRKTSSKENLPPKIPQDTCELTGPQASSKKIITPDIHQSTGPSDVNQPYKTSRKHISPRAQESKAPSAKRSIGGTSRVMQPQNCSVRETPLSPISCVTENTITQTDTRRKRKVYSSGAESSPSGSKYTASPVKNRGLSLEVMTPQNKVTRFTPLPTIYEESKDSGDQAVIGKPHFINPNNIRACHNMSNMNLEGTTRAVSMGSSDLNYGRWSKVALNSLSRMGGCHIRLVNKRNYLSSITDRYIEICADTSAQASDSEILALEGHYNAVIKGFESVKSASEQPL